MTRVRPTRSTPWPALIHIIPRSVHTPGVHPQGELRGCVVIPDLETIGIPTAVDNGVHNVGSLWTNGGQSANSLEVSTFILENSSS